MSTAQEIVLAHERDCRQVRALWEAVDGLRDTQGSIMQEQASERGRRKQSAWLVTLVMLLIGVGSVAAAWTAALRRDDRAANSTDALLQELHAIKAQLAVDVRK
jgi:hypothetical protein